MKFLLVTMFFSFTAFSQGNEIPLNAKPGECYTKVIIPAQYKYEKERILVSPADVKINSIPAKYGYEEKRILVREATEKHVTVPAKYKWIDDRVLISEASQRLIKVPAKYKKVAKRIMTAPATTEWKKGEQPNGTGASEALCLVEKPAQYKTVYEKVVVEPAKTITQNIPAQYKSVRKRVVDVPAQVKTIPVPAEYKTVKVRKMIEAPRQIESTIPAKYDFVTKKVKISESRTDWTQILCKTNAKPHVITKIQSALKRAGYNPGAVDGNLGAATLKAVERFQRAQGLPRGGITMETVKALNVQI